MIGYDILAPLDRGRTLLHRTVTLQHFLHGTLQTVSQLRQRQLAQPQLRESISHGVEGVHRHASISFDGSGVLQRLLALRSDTKTSGRTALLSTPTAFLGVLLIAHWLSLRSSSVVSIQGLDLVGHVLGKIGQMVCLFSSSVGSTLTNKVQQSSHMTTQRLGSTITPFL